MVGGQFRRHFHLASLYIRYDLARRGYVGVYSDSFPGAGTGARSRSRSQSQTLTVFELNLKPKTQHCHFKAPTMKSHERSDIGNTRGGRGKGGAVLR